MKRFAGALPVLLALGCGVPRTQYDGAIQDASKARDAKDQAEKQLADAKKEIDEQKKEIDEQKVRLGELNSQVAELKSPPEPPATTCDPTKPADTDELEELRRQKKAAEARARLFDDLMAKLRKMIDAGKLEVAIRHGHIVLGLGTDVLFDEAKTDLKPDGKEALVEIARVLKSVPGRRFQVSGHTDSLPIATKTFPSNWELSTERAVVVVKLLLNEGVRPAALSAAGYAEVDPVASNSGQQERAKNRRIEIVLVPNIEDLGIQLRRLHPDSGDKSGDKRSDRKKVDTKAKDDRKQDPKKK